ncbi:unnamed protein product, partial [Pleuronectes platessa]
MYYTAWNLRELIFSSQPIQYLFKSHYLIKDIMNFTYSPASFQPRLRPAASHRVFTRHAAEQEADLGSAHKCDVLCVHGWELVDVVVVVVVGVGPALSRVSPRSAPSSTSCQKVTRFSCGGDQRNSQQNSKED